MVEVDAKIRNQDLVEVAFDKQDILSNINSAAGESVITAKTKEARRGSLLR